MKYIFTTLVVLLLFACQHNRFVLTGQIDPCYNGKPITLCKIESDSVLSSDEVIIQEGKFRFNGEAYKNELAEIRFLSEKGEIQAIPLFLENGNITINIDSIITIGGTPLNDLYQSYADSVSWFKNKIKKESESPVTTNGYTVLEYNTPLYRLYIQYGKFLKQVQRENINNAVGQYIFLNRIKSNSRFYEEECIPNGHLNTGTVFNELYNLADSALKIHPIVLKYKKTIDKKIQREKDLANFEGQQAPDFELQTLQGESKKISDYTRKSKLLIIDFWASWCTPCITSIPDLKELYKQYHSKGLNIISISLDTDKAKWKKAADNLKMSWPQLSDLKGNNSDILPNYFIEIIPYVAIIDSEGRMVCMCHPIVLKTKIEEYLN